MSPRASAVALSNINGCRNLSSVTVAKVRTLQFGLTVKPSLVRGIYYGRLSRILEHVIGFLSTVPRDTGFTITHAQ
jgi:hypothetical protein